MLKYIIRNLLLVIPTMFCVVLIVFTINYLTPGDPVAIYYDFDYTEEQYVEKAAEWGLDKPYWEQFFHYIKQIVTKLDFGYSYYSGKNVMSELRSRFPVSLKLGLISVALTVVIGIPFGIIFTKADKLSKTQREKSVERFRTALAELVTKPLGMTDTAFYASESDRKRVAAPYYLDNGKLARMNDDQFLTSVDDRYFHFSPERFPFSFPASTHS